MGISQNIDLKLKGMIKFFFSRFRNISHEFFFTNNIITDIQKRIVDEPNSLSLKTDLDEIKIKLNNSTEEIPNYDIQRFNDTITSLLKDIDNKCKQDSDKKPKRFTFKKKLQTTSTVTIPTEISKSDLPTNNLPEYVTKSKIYLNKETFDVSLLDNCTISLPSTFKTYINGAIRMTNIKNCVVKFDKPVFQTGSIHLTDCTDSVILIKLATNDQTQIRLHNMIRCKLLFSSLTKQTIILEGCQDCIFHLGSKENLHIQDFSNLALAQENVPTNYIFKQFDTAKWDLDKLKSMYLSL